MVLDKPADTPRINARKTDAFDLFNFRHYGGPNPYLNTSALVFQWRQTSFNPPRSLDEYLEVISHRYPHLQDKSYKSHAHLFARTAVEVNRLDMGLHLTHWQVTLQNHCCHLAVQSLHERSSRAVVYAVWDWFEAITQNQRFRIGEQIEVIQELFRTSVYGGPTVYALFRTAIELGIPAFYLWDEGLMQYGYGRRQIRGIATTFNCDSHLDSDFTTRKDDCKDFLQTLGFPVPKGVVVKNVQQALSAAKQIGYPVAVKPVDGHKGIGVTADVQDEEDLEAAIDRALAAIPLTQSTRIIVEKSITGRDYRLLCVNGAFVAAMERRPASVVGDGHATIAELIERENRTPERGDTPTSPMGKIKQDEAMERYLAEQRLSLESVLEVGETIYLRKVANLSSGGVSIDATAIVHPDTIALAEDVAQYFQLTCLGIDVIAADISQSWKEGQFGILEINAAPGVYMHLCPAIGDRVDVTTPILRSFFPSSALSRIPIISFNQISLTDLQLILAQIMTQHPTWTIGAICQAGVLINQGEKVLHPQYNKAVQNLLRHPRLDLLLAEYRSSVLEQEGMFYDRSDFVILDQPTDTERLLARQVSEAGTVLIREGNQVSIQQAGETSWQELAADQPLSEIYLPYLLQQLER